MAFLATGLNVVLRGVNSLARKALENAREAGAGNRARSAHGRGAAAEGPVLGESKVGRAGRPFVGAGGGHCVGRGVVRLGRKGLRRAPFKAFWECCCLPGFRLDHKSAGQSAGQNDALSAETGQTVTVTAARAQSGCCVRRRASGHCITRPGRAASPIGGRGMVAFRALRGGGTSLHIAAAENCVAKTAGLSSGGHAAVERLQREGRKRPVPTVSQGCGLVCCTPASVGGHKN